MSAYYRRLTGTDEAEKLRCARSWSEWAFSTSRLYYDSSVAKKQVQEDNFVVSFARIECHYFVNGVFFRSDFQLLEEAHKIQHIPCVIVQGRYDLVCPMTSAWDLSKVLPHAKLQIIPDAGHAANEPGILDALIEATDQFRF